MWCFFQYIFCFCIRFSLSASLKRIQTGKVSVYWHINFCKFREFRMICKRFFSIRGGGGVTTSVFCLFNQMDRNWFGLFFHTMQWELFPRLNSMLTFRCSAINENRIDIQVDCLRGMKRFAFAHNRFCFIRSRFSCWSQTKCECFLFATLRRRRRNRQTNRYVHAGAEYSKHTKLVLLLSLLLPLLAVVVFYVVVLI